jgi:hypothetical protein
MRKFKKMDNDEIATVVHRDGLERAVFFDGVLYVASGGVLKLPNKYVSRLDEEWLPVGEK